MPTSFVSALESSLQAKLLRLLATPLIARLAPCAPPAVAPTDGYSYLDAVIRARSARRTSFEWAENPDGSVVVPVFIDYDDLHRGREDEIRRELEECRECPIAFLTPEQELLLRTSPLELLAVQRELVEVELVDYRVERVGDRQRVVEIRVARMPDHTTGLSFVAIIPNLVPLRRQLAGLRTVDAAPVDGPLAPLRSLLGLPSGWAQGAPTTGVSESTDRIAGFDEHQMACLIGAERTPHFAVIEGPPGSGKTRVIGELLRRELARGHRALLVSSTHVAVDNVVERLVPDASSSVRDVLEPHTLPVRYAARERSVSPGARKYWVSGKGQTRGATVASRVEATVRAALPGARALFDAIDSSLTGEAPISSAVANTESLVCGTPIGILSCQSVAQAPPGSFDLLVVDEVSKMTLPEFLAIAVKARRWVVVGDPAQLPPYNDVEENAVTLDDVVTPEAELACTVVERATDRWASVDDGHRYVVVASDVRATIEAIGRVAPFVEPGLPRRVASLDTHANEPIVVCDAEGLAEALERVAPGPNERAPDRRGTVWIVPERGIRVARPSFASGHRLLDERDRFQARLFDSAYSTYHALPWSIAAGHALPSLQRRHRMASFVVAAAELSASADVPGSAVARDTLDARIALIAERFALNTLSMFDWLAKNLALGFDVAPLRQLASLDRTDVRERVQPYIGSLQKQYRMRAALSAVPRRLFYFGRALHDGHPANDPSGGVRLFQSQGVREERNEEEGELVLDLVEAELQQPNCRSVLVITPYRAQEALLRGLVSEAVESGRLRAGSVDVCTFDRCQGREADAVFLSLVRSRASDFFDNPKRWNVALTRAKELLVIVGDVERYRAEAARAVDHRTGSKSAQSVPPAQNLLSRIVAEYANQVEGARR